MTEREKERDIECRVRKREWGKKRGCYDRRWVQLHLIFFRRSGGKIREINESCAEAVVLYYHGCEIFSFQCGKNRVDESNKKYIT